MNPATFRKVSRWLFPLLLFVMANIFFLRAMYANGLPRSFAEDAAYADLAVAASGTAFEFGEDQPALSARGALWTGLLIVFKGLFRDLVSLAFVLNFVSTLFLLFVGLRLARLFFDFQPFVVAAMILLALFPATLFVAVSGTPRALATALVLLAFTLHVEGLRDRRMILPFGAACCIALAMLIRVEFFWVWLVFFVHTFIMCLVRRESEGLVFIQFFTGLLILAAFMWPVVNRNMQLLGGIDKPWPAALDAALVLESGEVMDSTSAEKSASLVGHIGKSYARMLFGRPGLGAGWFGVLFGSVVLVMSSLRRKEDRPFLVLLALPLVLPFLHGISSLFLGWDGVDYLFAAFIPAYVLLIAYGVFRLPFVLEQVNALPESAATLGSRITWGVGFALLFIATTVGLVRSSTFQLLKLEAQFDTRTAYQRVAKSSDFDGKVVATDLPGWMAYQGTEVLDLTGSRTTDMLTCMAADGGIDPTLFSNMLKRRKPDVMVIWKARNRELLDMARTGLDATVTNAPSFPGGPEMIRLAW